MTQPENSAAERVRALEEELARLRADARDIAFVRDLRAGLARVSATAALAAPTEYASLLEQIVQTAMQVLGARAGSLYLVDEVREELVFEVALGDRASPLRGQRLPLGQGVAGWVAATGQAIAVADVEQDPRWAQQIGAAVGYAPKTMLAMPLLLHDRVTGVLQLLDKDGDRPFDAGDMATLGLFANQAAIAIEQGRTMQHLMALVVSTLAVLDTEGVLTPLVERGREFVTHTEESPEYRDTMELAALLGEIARQGESGRRLSLDITGAIVNFLRARPRW